MSAMPPVQVDTEPSLDSGLSPLRKLRIVALVELGKAEAVPVAGAGLLNVDAGTLQAGARALLESVSLDPAQGLAHGVMDLARDADRNPAWVAAVLWAYSAARFAEGGGLWFGRAWARWLGLVSYAAFIPFEIAYAIRQPSATALAVLALNLAAIWLLWPARADD